MPLYFAVVETTLLGDTIARAFSSFQILSVLCMNSRFFSARETIEQLVRNQSEIPESMPISQPVCVSSVFHRFNIDTASPSFSLVPRSISLRSFEGLDNRARTKEELSLFFFCAAIFRFRWIILLRSFDTRFHSFHLLLFGAYTFFNDVRMKTKEVDPSDNLVIDNSSGYGFLPLFYHFIISIFIRSTHAFTQLPSLKLVSISSRCLSENGALR